jgi:membrane-associated phospholipid phosphatase
MSAASDAPRTRAASPVDAFARCDPVLAAYQRTEAGLLVAFGSSTKAVPTIAANLVVLLAVAWFARRVPAAPAWLRSSAYKLVVVLTIVGSYLLLRDVLPALRDDALDATLAAIDEALFRTQPAFAIQRLNRRPVIEWLSFYYFGYYGLLAAYALGVPFFAPGERTKREFALGTALLFCTGHLVYAAVPAYGPYAFFEGRFDAPIDGGFFFGLVEGSVHSAGALKDVFPSMHTAGPTWFSLFALTQARRDPRWKLPAYATAFFAANVVVSTMVLRWHYVIDVLAGLTLAGTVAWATPLLAAREATDREARGVRLPFDFD